MATESMKSKYYIIEESALPEIFEKVLKAKELLETGEAKTVAQAAESVDLSRSAFYKYRDLIQPLRNFKTESVVTFHVTLHDRPGVLSKLLSVFQESGTNILTINQSIPINGTATVTISVMMGDSDTGPENLIDKMEQSEGVIKVDFMAG
ncbi:MAG: ACT domain-containing protein [Oscillospiraceae bacterium]|nr:ACT domain-containing protein [Oscillospiraceae bacterium]